MDLFNMLGVNSTMINQAAKMLPAMVAKLNEQFPEENPDQLPTHVMVIRAPDKEGGKPGKAFLVYRIMVNGKWKEISRMSEKDIPMMMKAIKPMILKLLATHREKVGFQSAFIQFSPEDDDVYLVFGHLGPDYGDYVVVDKTSIPEAMGSLKEKTDKEGSIDLESLQNGDEE